MSEVNVIPAGTSVVVSKDGDGDDHRRYDPYSMSERVKDAISRSDLTNANYAHQASDDTCSVKQAVYEARADVKNAVANSDLAASRYAADAAKCCCDIKGEVFESRADVKNAIQGSHQDVKNAIFDTSRQLCETGHNLDVAITAAAAASALGIEKGFAASQLATERGFANAATLANTIATNTTNMLISGFKDARYDAATNTAALQAALCAGINQLSREHCDQSRENALAFKEVELNSQRQHCQLSKELAACCCELKEKVGGVKDALKQQEIDRLREEMTQLKLEAVCGRHHHHCCDRGRRGGRDDD